MQLHLIETVQLPTWALCYIFNNDSSGLSDDEVQQVDSWYDGYTGGVTVALSADNESSFTTSPEFGLACDCETADIWGQVQ